MHKDRKAQEQPQHAGTSSSRKNAYVKIIEQPARNANRFRYECEGRMAGSIPGASSTPQNRTFPAIKIFGYTGKAVVLVSCVTKDPPYRPHPHTLVGKEGCKWGVCTLEVCPDTMTVVFSYLGIHCVKKRDIEAALRKRKEIRVDPFKTGFSHWNQPTSIDLNAVRLCFQVFLEDERGKFTVPLQPVVSDIIYDKRYTCDLVITKLSDYVCPVDGGSNDIILLCEKVAKGDIEVRFFDGADNRGTWEAFGDFKTSQIQYNIPICFRPPRYHTLELRKPARVFIQLRRPSDGATSDPLPFEYLPLDSDRGKRKKQKFESDPGRDLRRASEQERNLHPPSNMLNKPMAATKTEPRDPHFRQSTTMYNGGRTAQQRQPQQGGTSRSRKNPYVKIIEQPASKAQRFRYDCEGRLAGLIPGVSSIPEEKTLPTIKIFDYIGRAVVVVSCVTTDPPYRPHPHSLTGKYGCKSGVYIRSLEVSPDDMTVCFSIGIKCCKKKDIEAALRAREEIQVDPFGTGFSHRNHPTMINLSAVRLCFQVFLEDKRGKFTVPLQPVVSDIIHDKRALSDLVITKLSDCVCPVDGGTKDIILLCEKAAKDDIQVRFFEETDNCATWEAFGDFQPSHIQKQLAIWFQPPRYHTLDVTEPATVFIELRRPSDGTTSEPVPFNYLPLDSDRGKRKRSDHDLGSLSEQEGNLQPSFNMLNIPMAAIKAEPIDESDSTPLPCGEEIYSPTYAASRAVCPQYGSLVDPLSHTLPPPHMRDILHFQHQHQHVAANLESPQERPPSTSEAAMNDLDSASGINSLLNLDKQQLVLHFNLNSQELAKYTVDTNNLSERLSGLSLNDLGGVQVQDQNMTESLTPLANSTINKICHLNEICRPP